MAFERRDHLLTFQPDDDDGTLRASGESRGQQPLSVGRDGKNIRTAGKSFNHKFPAPILFGRPEIESSSRKTNQVAHAGEVD